MGKWWAFWVVTTLVALNLATACSSDSKNSASKPVLEEIDPITGLPKSKALLPASGVDSWSLEGKGSTETEFNSALSEIFKTHFAEKHLVLKRVEGGAFRLNTQNKWVFLGDSATITLDQAICTNSKIELDVNTVNGDFHSVTPHDLQIPYWIENSTAGQATLDFTISGQWDTSLSPLGHAESEALLSANPKGLKISEHFKYLAEGSEPKIRRDMSLVERDEQTVALKVTLKTPRPDGSFHVVQLRYEPSGCHP